MARRYKGLSKFGKAIADVLGEYTKEVDKAIKDGVPDAAERFRREAIEQSPVDEEGALKSPYGYYKDNWLVKAETTSRYHRYVGNAKTVPDRKNGDIPLINILEYSTDSRHNPQSRHVQRAINLSKEDIRRIFINLPISALQKSLTKTRISLALS